MGNNTQGKWPGGDYAEDTYYGSMGMYTGGEANRLALEDRRRQKQQQQAQLAATTGTRKRGGGQSAGSPKSIEDAIGGLICMALLVSIPYYGITELAIEWYWAVGIGVVVAVVAARLLKGPLYFILTLIKWLVLIGIVIVMMYLYFGRSGAESPNAEHRSPSSPRVELG